jgi:hypothetical protein
MPDYKNGQIYRLWTPHTDKYYIGSTCTMLAKRLWTHKADFKCYLNKKRENLTSYKLFEFGIDDVKIELMELFPCNSKKELEKREGELQREHKIYIVNSHIAGQTRKEYYQDNKNKISERHKNRYYEKRDEIRKKANDNYEINKDEINRKARERYARLKS